MLDIALLNHINFFVDYIELDKILNFIVNLTYFFQTIEAWNWFILNDDNDWELLLFIFMTFGFIWKLLSNFSQNPKQESKYDDPDFIEYLAQKAKNEKAKNEESKNEESKNE